MSGPGSSGRSLYSSRKQLVMTLHASRVQLKSVSPIACTACTQPYKAEVKAWQLSGAAHFGGNRGDRKGWVTNPTLLHPETGAWEVHYAASPYACFFPLDQGEDLSRNQRDPLQIAKVSHCCPLCAPMLSHCVSTCGHYVSKFPGYAFQCTMRANIEKPSSASSIACLPHL